MTHLHGYPRDPFNRCLSSPLHCRHLLPMTTHIQEAAEELAREIQRDWIMQYIGPLSQTPMLESYLTPLLDEMNKIVEGAIASETRAMNDANDLTVRLQESERVLAMCVKDLERIEACTNDHLAKVEARDAINRATTHLNK